MFLHKDYTNSITCSTVNNDVVVSLEATYFAKAISMPVTVNHRQV